MSAIDVLDSHGITQSLEKPLAPGRAAAVSSRPVVLSQEDKFALDAILAKISADPATQATLAAILAKLIAAPATEAKQDTANTSLSSIVTALATNHTDELQLHTDIATTLIAKEEAIRALLAGTLTVGSHAVTNAGTFAVQATLAAGATAMAKAEDAASADADVGVPAMAVRKATPANTSGADGDYEMLQMVEGCLHVLPRGPTATARLASSAATTNAANVKTAAGRVYQLTGKNNAAYDIFLVLYDSATNPPVPGTTPIRKKVICPAGQTFVYDILAGVYSSGIGYAFTKLVADADTTAIAAGDITAFNLDYA